MATLKQFEANRLNAQQSTGPRSLEGKAAVRFNALQSGIDAKSQVLPGEDPAALELLTAEYHQRFQPATPEVRALVDTLVTAEWLGRRFRTLEAQLWNHKIRGLFRPVEGFEVAQAYDNGSDTFDRLQRRVDAAQRCFHRTLEALHKIESRPPQPTEPADLQPPAPDPQPQPNQSPGPKIGFVPSISPEPSPLDPLPAVPAPLQPHPVSPDPPISHPLTPGTKR